MRKLLLVLPVAAVALAAGLLFAGLGRSLANAELPASEPASTAASTSPTTPVEATADDWTETGRKVPKVKSHHQAPNEPYPPGSRRRR